MPEAFASAAAFSRGCQRTSPTASPARRSRTPVTTRRTSAARRAQKRTGDRRDCERGAAAPQSCPYESSLRREDGGGQDEAQGHGEDPSAERLRRKVPAGEQRVPADLRQQVLLGDARRPGQVRLAEGGRETAGGGKRDEEEEEAERVSERREERGEQQQQDGDLEPVEQGAEEGARQRRGQKGRRPAVAEREDEREERRRGEEDPVGRHDAEQAPPEVLGARDGPGQDHLERAARDVPRHGARGDQEQGHEPRRPGRQRGWRGDEQREHGRA